MRKKSRRTFSCGREEGSLTQTGLDEQHLPPMAVSGGPTEGGCRRTLRRQRGVGPNQPSGGPYGLPKDGEMPPITKTVEADVDADACVLVVALGLRNAFPWPSRNPKMSSLWTAKSTPATASSGGVEFAAVIVGVTNPPVDYESNSLTRSVECLALEKVDKQGKTNEAHDGMTKSAVGNMSRCGCYKS